MSEAESRQTASRLAVCGDQQLAPRQRRRALPPCTKPNPMTLRRESRHAPYCASRAWPTTTRDGAVNQARRIPHIPNSHLAGVGFARAAPAHGNSSSQPLPPRLIGSRLQRGSRCDPMLRCLQRYRWIFASASSARGRTGTERGRRSPSTTVSASRPSIGWWRGIARRDRLRRPSRSQVATRCWTRTRSSSSSGFSELNPTSRCPSFGRSSRARPGSS